MENRLRSRPFVVVLALALAAVPPALGQATAKAFDAPLVVGGAYSRFTNTLDFDGDGWMDAISVWYPPTTYTEVEVQGWRNDQTGKLVPAWAFTQSLGTATLLHVDAAAGDMNGDGRDDFVLGVGAVLQFYLSNGMAAPTLWAIAPTGGGLVSSLKMSDFDGDGIADVAYLTSLGVGVTLVKPSGPPFPTSTQGTIVATTYVLFLAEVNGDGIKDVGVATASTGTQIRLHPVVGGALQAPSFFVLPGVFNPMPTAGDIDGDGDEDVVVFDSATYRVLRRTGPAAFTLDPFVIGGPATGLADIDQDGDLDGVCCGGGGTAAPANVYFSNYEISINDGGVFAPAFTVQGLGSTRLAGAVDLDADGDLDLIGGRCVWYADGPIARNPLPTVGTGGQTPRTVADLDRDGDPDLQPGLGGGSYPCFRNAGDGTFASAPVLLPPAPAGSTFSGPGWPGDFDADGDVDLIVAQNGAGGAFVQMRLLLNGGGGGFTDGGPAGAAGVDFRVVPSGAPNVATLSADATLADDVDGDGDVDLVVRAAGNYVAGSRIWFNGGSGFFTPGPELAGNYALVVANLDLDSPVDIVGVYPSTVGLTGPLRLCRGTGGGGFAAPDATPIAALLAFWDRPAFSDLDGDGDLDVLTPDGANLVLLVNDGNGSFGAAGTAGLLDPYGSTPRRAFVADVDADGIADLVGGPVLNGGGVGTAVRLGTGTPFSFQPPVVHVFTASVLTDVDGDGDPDGLGAKLAVNRGFRPPSGGLRRQYGAGLAGSLGNVPTLGAVGPFRSGLSGETRITGGLGGAAAIFGIGLQEANTPILGGTLLIDPVVTFPFTLSGAPGVPGAGKFTLGWTAYPWLVGTAFHQQVAIADPGAPQGYSLTNGLHSLIGP